MVPFVLAKKDVNHFFSIYQPHYPHLINMSLKCSVVKGITRLHQNMHFLSDAAFILSLMKPVISAVLQYSFKLLCVNCLLCVCLCVFVCVCVCVCASVCVFRQSCGLGADVRL